MKAMIVGAGKLGLKLAETMQNNKIDVTLIDLNQRVIERALDHLDVLTVHANGLDVDILRELNIETYDFMIACTSSDESNTIICRVAKKLGCAKTIARIRNPEYSRQMEFLRVEMGIDYIVNPDMSIANEITRYLLKSYNFYSGDYAKGRVQLVDIGANHLSGYIGKKIMQLDHIEGMLITAILRDGHMMIPSGHTVIEPDDILYIIGKRESIQLLREKSNTLNKSKEIQKVMLMGGGKIAYYLAREMSEMGVSVTIVEKDRENCKRLADELNSVLVIHGDGTDLHLLEEESLSEMDAFIGVTGYDEQNLLMALMAKHEGVSKVVAKISRPSYTQIVDKMGIDVALNPITIAVSDILRYVRGGKVVSVSLLLGGQAEVNEVIIDPKNPIVGKTLLELGLPKGVIIGAMVKDSRVLIPNGSTTIGAHDRLIIFSLANTLESIGIFFKEEKGNRLNELWNRRQGIRKYINT